MTNADFDVIICGAGPGGLAAAHELSAVGARVAIVDEQPQAGGQFLRQPPSEFRVPRWLSSGLYAKGKALLQSAKAIPHLTWHFNTTIHGLFREQDNWRLWATSGETQVNLKARYVIVATGCYDLPVPFPGWTLPGVMSAGGIQTFIKSPQILPGKNFALSGSHPLLLVLADQIIQAGGHIAALCLSQSAFSSFALLKTPGVMAENIGKFFATAKILLRLKAAGVSIQSSSAVTSAIGENHVSAAEISQLDQNGNPIGQKKIIPCDAIGTCYGFLASSELARSAGAKAVWDDNRGGWIIPVDVCQQSDMPGLYIAGEVTGVDGADMAAVEGKIAGIVIANKLANANSHQPEPEVTPSLERIQAEKRKHHRFASVLRALSSPPKNLLAALRTNDTIVCRCEDLSVKQLKQVCAENEFIDNPNALKFLIRSGMGPCQGRMCGHAIIALMRETKRLDVSEQPTGFTVRAPIKPVGLWTIPKV